MILRGFIEILTENPGSHNVHLPEYESFFLNERNLHLSLSSLQCKLSMAHSKVQTAVKLNLSSSNVTFSERYPPNKATSLDESIQSLDSVINAPHLFTVRPATEKQVALNGKGSGGIHCINRFSVQNFELVAIAFLCFSAISRLNLTGLETILSMAKYQSTCNSRTHVNMI
jgi:hypothetical protein